MLLISTIGIDPATRRIISIYRCLFKTADETYLNPTNWYTRNRIGLRSWWRRYCYLTNINLSTPKSFQSPGISDYQPGFIRKNPFILLAYSSKDAMMKLNVSRAKEESESDWHSMLISTSNLHETCWFLTKAWVTEEKKSSLLSSRQRVAQRL